MKLMPHVVMILVAAMLVSAENRAAPDFEEVFRLFNETKFLQVTFDEGQTLETMLKVGKMLSEIGQADNLNEVLKQLREVSDSLKYLLIFVDPHLPIAAINKKLGKEDRQISGGFYVPPTSDSPASIEEKIGAHSKPLMWHHYDWLHFGVADAHVVVLRIDCKTFPVDK
jgi:hypothetical protein